MIFFYIFMAIGGISIFIGLDLKKWHSWLIGVYGFVIGFLMGLVWVDISTAIIAGMLFAFLTLASGATVYRTRQKAKQALDSWSLDQENQERYPMLTRYMQFLKNIFRI